MTLRVSVAARNAGLDAQFDLVDAGLGSGRITLYSGDYPETADTPLSGLEEALVVFTLNDPGFTLAVNGSKELNLPLGPLTAVADATGTPQFAQVTDSDGTVVFIGTVSTSNADFVINLATISSGQDVALLMGTITDPASPF